MSTDRPERRHKPDRRPPNRGGGRRISDIAPDWLTIDQWAERYSASRSQVIKWLAAGLFYTTRQGRYIRIRNLRIDDHKAYAEYMAAAQPWLHNPQELPGSMVEQVETSESTASHPGIVHRESKKR